MDHLPGLMDLLPGLKDIHRLLTDLLPLPFPFPTPLPNHRNPRTNLTPHQRRHTSRRLRTLLRLRTRLSERNADMVISVA